MFINNNKKAGYFQYCTMSLLEECEECFGTSDFYEIFAVSKTANESEVKKAYYKVSLKIHPDRVSEDKKETATKKFQTLGKVYCILSDKDKRKIYDDTGEVPEDGDFVPPNSDWEAYWRCLFPKVTQKDIEEFEKKYKGSEEELEAIKEAYVRFEGRMEEILSHVMCAEVEDEDRISDIIKKLIKKKEVPEFKVFSKENKKTKEARKRKAKKEAEEAEELQQELGLNGDDSLKALIQSRQKSRESQMSSFFDDLEAKYAKPKRAKVSSAKSSKTSKTKKTGKK